MPVLVKPLASKFTLMIAVAVPNPPTIEMTAPGASVRLSAPLMT